MNVWKWINLLRITMAFGAVCLLLVVLMVKGGEQVATQMGWGMSRTGVVFAAVVVALAVTGGLALKVGPKIFRGLMGQGGSGIRREGGQKELQERVIVRTQDLEDLGDLARGHREWIQRIGIGGIVAVAAGYIIGWSGNTLVGIGFGTVFLMMLVPLLLGLKWRGRYRCPECGRGLGVGGIYLFLRHRRCFCGKRLGK